MTDPASERRTGPDFVTIDVFDDALLLRPRWWLRLRSQLRAGVPGLRGGTVNYANHATHRLLRPGMVPGTTALVTAWEAPEAAEDAFDGPLRWALQKPPAFSLDGEVVRVKVDAHSERDHWHGWQPSAEGARPLEKDDPMVVLVHGILKRGELLQFAANNIHAASRAAHHPGHRGSVDISSHLPYEHTSVSLWKSYGLAQDFAYKPGGHAQAMKHALLEKTHRVGVFTQVRPVASSGRLGLEVDAFPDLPPTSRRAAR